MYIFPKHVLELYKINLVDNVLLGKRKNTAKQTTEKGLSRRR